MSKELDYDEILNNWHDKVVEKADSHYKIAYEHETDSKTFWRNKIYADALYMSIAMLSNEERKAKRRINNN